MLSEKVIKTIKNHIFELLFLISFLLPFIQTTTVRDGVKTVNSFSGVDLLIDYYYVFLPIIVFFGLYLYFKRNYLKYIAFVAYLCFILFALTFGEIMAIPPKSYLEFFAYVLPKMTLFGLPINFLLAILVVVNPFAKKQ